MGPFSAGLGVMGMGAALAGAGGLAGGGHGARGDPAAGLDGFAGALALTWERVNWG